MSNICIPRTILARDARGGMYLRIQKFGPKGPVGTAWTFIVHVDNQGDEIMITTGFVQRFFHSDEEIVISDSPVEFS